MKDKFWAYKSKCLQCGKCCQTEVCLLGKVILRTAKIPCVALINRDGRYWCGLITDTKRYVFPELDLNDKQLKLIKEHLLSVNNFGEGCDLEEWHLPGKVSL